MYCHYIGTFTGSLVYLRFTSHWSASKKSSVMTLCIKVAKQIIFFVPKISVIQAVSASSFFSLLLFFSSSLPSFLHFFLAFIFLSKKQYIFCNMLGNFAENLKSFFLEISFLPVFAFAFILSLWPNLIFVSKQFTFFKHFLYWYY